MSNLQQVRMSGYQTLSVSVSLQGAGNRIELFQESLLLGTRLWDS
jgi:hypothetical protein